MDNLAQQLNQSFDAIASAIRQGVVEEVNVEIRTAEFAVALSIRKAENEKDN